MWTGSEITYAECPTLPAGWDAAPYPSSGLTLLFTLWTLAALKVLIAPDKFKGTLSAREAALVMAHGWRQVRPMDELEVLPITDGGDGFGESMARLMRASSRAIRSVNAARKPCRVNWWWEPLTRTAIIESARVIGLAMLPAGRFHPLALDTFGLGKLLHHVSERGAHRCLVGIGGSATNDGGFGLARALGWEFLDRARDPIEHWTDLVRLDGISAPQTRTWPRDLVVAVDVQNPLLGVRGATRVYGPQKGLRARDLPQAERCLRRLSNVVEHQFGLRLSSVPGAGAAGGLGFGLMAFCGARLEGGFDLFARKAQLVRRLRKTAVVLTGEGKIDRSTFMGKGVGRLAQLCQERRIPCLGFAGTPGRGSEWRSRFNRMYALTELTTLSKAKTQPSIWLKELAAQAARSCQTL